MRKIKAKNLAVRDMVHNKGTVEEVERDGEVVCVKFASGEKVRYMANARLFIED